MELQFSATMRVSQTDQGPGGGPGDGCILARKLTDPIYSKLAFDATAQRVAQSNINLERHPTKDLTVVQLYNLTTPMTMHLRPATLATWRGADDGRLWRRQAVGQRFERRRARGVADVRRRRQLPDLAEELDDLVVARPEAQLRGRQQPASGAATTRCCPQRRHPHLRRSHCAPTASSRRWAA